jgi:hypothetical protein
MNILDNYGVFHPAAMKSTSFSAAYATFSKLHHILGHKVCLNKSKKIEITPCILSDNKKINKTKLQQQKKTTKNIQTHGD